jgi:transposase-like protein
MTKQENKCLLCGEQMLSLACPGGCFTATAHEVDGLACKDRQRARAARAEAAAESATEDSDEQVAVVMHEQSMVIERLTRERDEAQETNRNNVAGHEQQIADLKCELIEARAACAKMRELLEKHGQCDCISEGAEGQMQCDVCFALTQPNLGQPLLDELARLRRCVKATFAWENTPDSFTLIEYRAALLAAMKGETKP